MISVEQLAGLAQEALLLALVLSLPDRKSVV